MDTFDDLERFLEEFQKAILRTTEDSSYAHDLCEMSRKLHMRCALAVFNEERTWLPIAKKVLKAFRDAVRACPGSVFQNNIAVRTKHISELVDRPAMTKG